MPCGGGNAAAQATGAPPGSATYTAVRDYKCGHWGVLVIAFLAGIVVGRWK